MDAILLSPHDNVAVLVRAVPTGAAVAVAGATVVVDRDLGLGHKVAVRAIPCGGKVLKHGVAIGSATRDIGPGEHVHVHNMRSDYLPTVAPAIAGGAGGGP